MLALTPLLGAHAAQARPARPPTPPPAAAIARAEELQKAGRWTEGNDLLLTELNGCDMGAAGRPCRLLFARALGYLSQRQAELDPKQQSGLLRRSAEWYGQALKEDPADGAALTNLTQAFRALGADDDLLRLLPSAMERDPSNAGFYARVLGDLHRSRGAWPEALSAYRQAVAAAPDNETARRRLVEVYRQLPADSARGLFALVSGSGDWEARFPDAAARAYEVVVDALARHDRRIAVTACLRWVNVLADARLLTTGRLNVLAESWLTAELRQLARFLSDSLHPMPGGSIWTTPEGREAVGRAALAAGRQQRSAGDAVGAEALWQAGMRAARYHEPVSLDLALETAALYQQRPALDPNGGKFREIEERLISEKGTAIYRADSVAIQRFHTVLGLLYSQRGKWGSSGEPFSAVYQLERALRMARARDSVGGFYQPLPQLRAFLAQAYDTTGRPARDAYLDAAKAYLDADALDDARRMLDRRQAGRPASDPPADALASLIVQRAAAGAAPERPPQGACEATANRSVASPNAGGLGAAFLKRQRFKLLADCVLAGPAPVRPEDAARVLTVAADDNVPLVGAGDLVRLQRSQAAVLRLVRVPTDPGGRDAKQPSRSTDLRLLMPSTVRPTVIPVSPDLLIGARVAVQVGADPAVRDIRVRAGEVTVTSDVSDAERASLQAKIRGVGGVRSAEIRSAGGVTTPVTTPVTAPPAEVQRAIANYAAALETRSLARVRAIVPDPDDKALDALFRQAIGLKVDLRVVRFTPEGERALATIEGVYHYSANGTLQQQQVRLQAVFFRGAEGWKLGSIR